MSGEKRGNIDIHSGNGKKHISSGREIGRLAVIPEVGFSPPGWRGRSHADRAVAMETPHSPGDAGVPGHNINMEQEET